MRANQVQVLLLICRMSLEKWLHLWASEARLKITQFPSSKSGKGEVTWF